MTYDSKQCWIIPLERKQLRQSTAQKSALREKREKELEVRKKMMKEIAAKKNVTEVRRLTQEELLEEAKETEAINLQALGQSHPHFDVGSCKLSFTQ